MKRESKRDKDWNALVIIIIILLVIGIIVFANYPGYDKEDYDGDLGSLSLFELIGVMFGNDVVFDDPPEGNEPAVPAPKPPKLYYKERFDGGDDPQNPGCVYVYLDKMCSKMPDKLFTDSCHQQVKDGEFDTVGEQLFSNRCSEKDPGIYFHRCDKVCGGNNIKKKSNGCKYFEDFCEFKGKEFKSAYCDCYE